MKKAGLLILCALLSLTAFGQAFDAGKSYTLATPEGDVVDSWENTQLESPLLLSAPDHADRLSCVWQVKPLGDGICQLVNGYTFFAIDNAGGTDEHPALQWNDEKDNRNQQWRLRRNPDGSYGLISVASGLAYSRFWY